MNALYATSKNGERLNVIYGYADPERYRKNPFFLGATCGRYAGRVGGHAFTIEGREYRLESEGEVHLHGGSRTLGFRQWELKEIEQGEHPKITYRIKSGHLDGGYPGNIEVEACYTLIENSLLIEYKALSDRSTHLNLTNHNYYNLAGGGSIADHLLTLDAESILETDLKQVPTGNLTQVKDTPFDHTTEKKMALTLQQTSLDHVFVLGEKVPQANLYAPESGIEMTLTTDQPGVVVFTPGDLGEGPWLNKAPEAFPAICLEAQNFPDAPNVKHFPSSLVEKGVPYYNKTILEFGLR